jgi:hypothetical protein
MPSARDLLQQADALMRSHRNLGSSDAQETVPVLTDVAIPGSATVVTRQRIEEIPVLTNVVAEAEEVPVFNLEIPTRLPPAPHHFPPTQTDALLLPLSEMPPIPAIDEDDTTSAFRDSRVDERAVEPGPIDDEMPKWLEADLLETGPANTAAEPARDPQRDSERLDWDNVPDDDSAPTESPISEPDPIPESPDEPVVFVDPGPSATQPLVGGVHGAANDEPRAATPPLTSPPQQPASSAEELADTVYFQVLQNLDLYTERALQQHMTAHLSPIIERATQDLLTTLNANLGALIRQFVADAIEKQLGVRPASSDKPTLET